MFTLGVDNRSGRRETYGINVFKVREVMRVPEITQSPDMPNAVQGMVSLARRTGAGDRPGQIRRRAMRCQTRDHDCDRIQRPHPGFSGRGSGHHPASGLVVHARSPEMLASQTGGLVTAVTELPTNAW